MLVADQANEYINVAAPWTVAKDPDRKHELHVVLTTGINLFRAICCALHPILPKTTASVERYLRLPSNGLATFNALNGHLADHTVSAYEPLLTRIDPKHIETMIEASKESLQAPAAATGDPPHAAITTASANAAPSASSSPVIGIEDFSKLDLRIGRVLACELVEGSDKLLRFELDAGSLGKRQIFSGIRAGYAEPDRLIGRNVVFIANLAPRKMRFGLSEGMILSAGLDGGGLFLLDVDPGAEPGMPVR
jgi:methionyl-tRNA synthetase